MSNPKYDNFWRAVGYYGHVRRVDTSLPIMASLGMVDDLVSPELRLTWQQKSLSWDLMEFSLMRREIAQSSERE